MVTTAPAILPQSLSAAGPWLIAKAEDGIWAANADGSGLTQLVTSILINQIAPAPGGGRIAFIESNGQQYNGLTLNLLTLPGGEVTMITPLQQEGVDYLAFDIGQPEFESARAIVEHKALAWSPDGKVLAFVGAPETPTADLYMYFVADERIVHVSEEPSQVYGLNWSADNNHIVFGGVETFGTGAGYAMTGMWVAHADGSGVEPLYTPAGGDETILGWKSPDMFVAVGWTPDCGSRDIHLHSVNNLNGAPQTVHNNCFNAAAFDPASGAIMFVVDQFLADFSETKQEPGVYLIAPDADAAKKIADAATATQIEWSPENNAFVVATEEAVLAFAPTGEAVDPAGLIQMTGLSQGSLIGLPKAWSPDGQSVAAVSQGLLYVADRSDLNAKLVTDQLSIESITWVGQ
jgi:dipeptidyl aminopeptidase/acylaminoacyl peptidase